jgi:hypothetical protein
MKKRIPKMKNDDESVVVPDGPDDENVVITDISETKTKVARFLKELVGQYSKILSAIEDSEDVEQLNDALGKLYKLNSKMAMTFIESEVLAEMAMSHESWTKGNGFIQ